MGTDAVIPTPGGITSFPTVIYDTTGTYDPVLSRYLVPVTGNYHFEVMIPWEVTGVSTFLGSFRVMVSLLYTTLTPSSSIFEYTVGPQSRGSGTSVIVDDRTVTAGTLVFVVITFTSTAGGTLTISPMGPATPRIFSGFLLP